MKLPNATQAIVSVEKLGAYLLDPSHPDNGGKAGFFFRFGFKPETPGLLGNALTGHAASTEIARAAPGFGGSTLYVLEGPLETPRGRSPKIRSIWVIERNQTLPRFVTAYPAK